MNYNDEPKDTVIILKKGDTERILNEELIRKHTEKLITHMMQDIETLPDFGKSLSLTKVLIDVKKVYWPATQRQLTADISETFDKQVSQFLELRKEERELQKLQEKEDIKNAGTKQTRKIEVVASG
jgi:hypothetical protein|tara:strand:- start:1835 stop:2212 length:378 start_codon:yes stop_codon:yes gene_type:complete